MHSPKVSVIVPVYNVEKYIERCIDSLLQQTFTDFEIIVVDDRSPCRSVEIVKSKYQRWLGTRIRLINREVNGGLGAARNTGVKMANAPFVFFLDSDDWLDSDALAQLVEAQQRSSADIVVADYYIATEQYAYPAYTFRGLTGDQNAKGHILNYNPTAWNKLYSRQLFLDSQLFFPEEKQWYEDVATIPMLVLYASKIEVVNKPLIYYFQRSDSIMGSARSGSEKLFDIFKSAKRLIENRRRFTRKEWIDFEHNLIFHCAPARLHDIITIKNLAKRYRFMQQLYRLLNDVLPHWKQSLVMDQFAYNFKQQFKQYQRCYSHFKNGNLFLSLLYSLRINRDLSFKPKILFVLPALQIGGAEKVFCNLLNMMEKGIADISVYVFEKSGPMAEQLPKSGIRVINRNSIQDEMYGKSFLQVLGNRRYTWRNKLWKLKVSLMGQIISRAYTYRKFVRPYGELPHHHFDFAACFTELTPPMNDFVLNMVNASQKVIWIHNDFNPKFLDYIDDAYFKNCLRQFDGIVAVSSGAASSLAARFPAVAEKIKVINNVIDETEIWAKSEVNTEIDFDSRWINLVSVGRVSLQPKGYDRLLPILGRLKREGIPYRWHLVGDGPDMPVLKELLLREDVADRVVLHGSCNNPYPFIKQADALVLPSRFEAYPTVVLEAHILGTPCIVCENAGTIDQFKKVKGLVVENSEKGIYQGVKSFLTDNKLRNRMRKELKDFRYPNKAFLSDVYELMGIRIKQKRATKTGLIVQSNMNSNKKHNLKEVAI